MPAGRDPLNPEGRTAASISVALIIRSFIEPVTERSNAVAKRTERLAGEERLCVAQQDILRAICDEQASQPASERILFPGAAYAMFQL
jgi:hypothetical protein